MGNVKFIRVNGRVIPVGGKGSSPKGSGISKRYGAKREQPKGKSIGVTKGAAIGAGAGVGSTFGVQRKLRVAGKNTSFLEKVKSLKIKSMYGRKSTFKAAALGAIAGAVVGSVKLYKKGRGESDKQLAKRIGKPNKSGV